MTLADEIQAVRNDLDLLYREQRSSEQAPLDGRVTNEADRLAAIDRRSEQIRQAERRLAELEREWASDDDREAAA